MGIAVTVPKKRKARQMRKYPYDQSRCSANYIPKNQVYSIIISVMGILEI
jgi:hypothetical protein